MKYLKLYEDFSDEWEDEDEEDDELIIRIDYDNRNLYHVVVYHLDKDGNEIVVDRERIPEIYLFKNGFSSVGQCIGFFNDIADKYGITKVDNIVKTHKRGLLRKKKAI